MSLAPMTDYAVIGDVITLETDKGTFLSVDVMENVLWATILKGWNPPAPSNFNNCLWRITEKLSYVEQEMANLVKRKNSVDGNEIELVIQEAEREAERNLTDLVETTGNDVLYGRVIQLQHIATGKFLCAKNAAALLDRDCLALSLSSGSDACYFRVLPKYKIRVEGGHINFSDNIMLSSLSAPGFQVHESKQAPIGKQTHKGGYTYNEANLSRSAVDASPSVKLYARYQQDDAKYLRTGKSIRLFDRELEGFLQGLCFSNAHRDDGPKMTVTTLSGNVRLLKEGLDLINTGIENTPGMAALQALNPLDDTKKRKDRAKAAKTAVQPHIAPKINNPLHPDRFSSKSAFVFESVGRQAGGLIEWNKQIYRIRHVATGKYLTVGTEDLMKPDQNPLRAFEIIPGMGSVASGLDATVKAAEKMKERLEEAASDKKPGAPPAASSLLGGKKDEKVFTLTLEDEVNSTEQISRQTFQIKTCEVTEQVFVPKDDCMVSLAHIQSDGTELYFHSNGNRTVCMSSNRRSYDCVLLCNVATKQEEMVRFISDISPILWKYCYMLGEERKFPTSTLDLEMEIYILGRLILESMIGGKDPSLTDPMTAESLPLTVFQNCAREQLVLELLCAVIMAPVNAEMLLSYSDKNEEKKTDWDDKDFKPLVPVHKLAWRAMMALVNSNGESEMYLITVTAKTVPPKLKEDDGMLGVPALDHLIAIAQPPEARKSNAPAPGVKKEEPMGVGGTAMSLIDGSALNSIELPKLDGIEIPDMSIDNMSNTFSEWGDDPEKLLNTFRPAGLPPPWGRPDEDPFKAGPPTDAERPHIAGETITSVAIIVNQISYPLGAAEVLTTLISNNPTLLTKVVDITMIEYFKYLIRNEGPSARFIQFFQAVNTCRGKPISINQEMCLTELVNKPDDFDFLMIKIYSVEHATPMTQLIDSVSPTSKVMDERYFGRDSLVDGGGFPRVFVSWKGEEKWEMGSNNLFYSPKALDIATFEDVHVPIEELCWPLEPEHLYPLVKGNSWSDKEYEIRDNETSREIFERHSMLAHYFKAQIDLYAEMLRGRAYNVMFVIEKMFPYPMMLSLIANNKLPFCIRASAIKLLKYLWIQRYPHEENCGRQSIPNRLWVYTALNDCKLTDSGVLPYFVLSKNSSLLKRPESFYNIGHAHKFWMLNRFTSSFFAKNGIVRQIADNRSQNTCVNELIGLVRDLTSLGFYPSTADITDVQTSLLSILDGRADVERDNERGYSSSRGSNKTSISNFCEDGRAPDQLLDSVKRYRLDEKTIVIMETKRKIIDVLISVVNFRNQYRIAKFLYLFKVMNEGGSPVTVEAICDIVDPANSDGNELGLDKLAQSIPLEATLLDLMMYSDEKLFEYAFTLLTMERESTKAIFEVAPYLMILENNKLPEFGTYEQLDFVASELRRLIGTAEVWGESTALSPSIDVSNYKSLWVLFSQLNNFIKTAPIVNRQELLYLLDVHGTLFIPLGWDFAVKGNGEDPSKPGKSKNTMFKIAENSIELLISMVSRNSIVQKAFVSNYEVILGQASYFPRAYSLLIEIFKGSKQMVLNTPPSLFNIFGNLLGDPSTTSLAQQFFFEQLVPDRSQADVSIPRNQLLVVEAIAEAIKSKTFVFDLVCVQSDKQFGEYIAIVETLGLCCRGNRDIGTRMMRSILPWELVAARVVQVLQADPSIPGFGLGLKDKEPPKLGEPGFKPGAPKPPSQFSPPDGPVSKALRSRFLSSSINFLNWINLDAKGVDVRIVNHPLMIVMLMSVAKSLMTQEGVTANFAALASTSTLTRMAAEEEIMAKVSLLLSLVKTEVCQDSPTLTSIQMACVKTSSSNYPKKITALAMKVVDFLIPGEAKPDGADFSFRPGQNGNDSEPPAFAYAPKPKSLTQVFHEFVDGTVETMQPRFKEEKMSVLRALLRVQELTDPNLPEFAEKRAKDDVIENQNLELAEKGEAPETSIFVKRETRTNTITWKNLTARMISYIDGCLLDERPLDITYRILELFLLYLEEAKEMDSKIVIKVGEEVESELKKRQLELNEFGITALIFRIIGQQPAGPIFTMTMAIGNLMMEGGNLVCQTTLISYARENDADGKFFMNVKKALQRAAEWVSETKYDANASPDAPAPEVSHEVAEAVKVLDFLRELCAGHNFELQDAMRDQSKFNRQVYNLIDAANSVVESIVPRRDVFRHILPAHIEILLHALLFLVEACCGPCPENQRYLSTCKTFASCKIILSCETKHIDPSILTHVRCTTVQLINSCLEGRHGTTMEDCIMSKIENSIFDSIHVELHTKLQAVIASRSEELILPVNAVRVDHDIGEIEKGGAVAAHSSTSSHKQKGTVLLSQYTFEYKPVTKSHLELTLRDLTCTREKLAEKNAEFNPFTSTSENFVGSYSKFKETLRSVEVSWNGHTETAFFPLANECRFLSEATKMDFLELCELDSPDVRVKGLMENLERFFDEMVVFERLTSSIPGYQWMLKNYFYVKLTLFAVAVLLNVNIILTFIQYTPANSYFENPQLPTSAITLGIGSFLMGGYLSIVLYWILPAFPMKMRSLTRESESRKAELEESGSTGETNRDWSAFNFMFCAITFFTSICIIHYYSQIDRHTFYGLLWTYFCTFMVIFGSWFIIAFRQFLKTPMGYLDYFLCLNLDVFSNSNLLIHLGLLGCVIAGLFIEVYMFTILLLDFVLLSEHAKNVVKSIVRPWQALLSILIMFLVVIVIFGLFGILQFGTENFISNPHDFSVDDSPPGNATAPYLHGGNPDYLCNTLTSCMAVIFYTGIRTFDMSEMMPGIYPGYDNTDFSQRVFYDILFFIVLGVLLFNMVTGIIVDTFASLREETDERMKTLAEESFISGLDAETLELAALNFDTVQDEKQNKWNYVYFIFYLRKKDPALYDGLEAYVVKCIDEQENKWFPKRTCAALEKVGGGGEEEDATAAKLESIESRMERIEKLIQALAEGKEVAKE